jgi:hypothetical protein
MIVAKLEKNSFESKITHRRSKEVTTYFSVKITSFNYSDDIRDLAAKFSQEGFDGSLSFKCLTVRRVKGGDVLSLADFDRLVLAAFNKYAHTPSYIK